MGKRKISDDNMFFGLNLTDEQREMRDAIYGDDYDIVFCNAKAGTGKTTIAVATAKLLVQENKYDGLVYIVNPVQEARQGYLPGDINEKTRPYAEPLEDALIKVGDFPEKAIRQFCMSAGPSALSKGKDKCEKIKGDSCWVDCISHTFLRGANFENKIVIVDEAQNAYVDELQKILTRPHDNCKIIVIGHGLQCDLIKKPERSGFLMFLEHFTEKERCKVCNLTKNFRGWVSQWADELNVQNVISKLEKNNNKA